MMAGSLEIISSLVNGVLFNETEQSEQGHRVRIRIARMIRYARLSDAEMQLVKDRLHKDSNENKEVQNALAESWKNAGWRESEINKLTNEEIQGLSPSALLRIVENVRWSELHDDRIVLLANRFIQIIQDKDKPLDSQALDLLLAFSTTRDKTQSAKDKEQVVKWLGEILYKREDLREDCRKNIAKLQDDSLIAWQSDIWEHLWKLAVEEGDIRIVNSLESTQRREAYDFLQSIREQSPIDWFGRIDDALLELAERIRIAEKPYGKDS